jgi:hypothetical protein
MDAVLTEMSMGSAYAGGDFSGMVEGGGLFLDTVQHDAFIEVDEAGNRGSCCDRRCHGGVARPNDRVQPPLFLCDPRPNHRRNPVHR